MRHLHFSHLAPSVLIPNENALKSTQINTDTLVTVVCLISCWREIDFVGIKPMQERFFLSYQQAIKGGLLSVCP